MIIRSLLAFFIAAWSWAAQAQVPLTLAGNPGSGTGVCGAATSLTARMDGSENVSAVNTLICGMVNDATYSLLDALYVFATNSTTNANLNWAQNAFNLTTNGTITFSANNGYTSNGTTGWLNSGYTPSTAGGQLSQNSVTIGGCDLTNRTTSASNTIAGVSDGSNFISFNANTSNGGGLVSQLAITDSTGSANFAVTTSLGSWIGTRVNSTQITGYLNGVSQGTMTQTSSGLPANLIPILAFRTGTSESSFSTDQIAYVFWGAGMNSTQVTNVYNRLHTYLSTVGAASGC